MSRSHGPGSPIWFRCTKCRGTLRGDRDAGWAGGVELTGRQRPSTPKRALGSRSTFVAREYRCLTCGFVGWSTHVDLARKAGDHPDLHIAEDGSTYLPSWARPN